MSCVLRQSMSVVKVANIPNIDPFLEQVLCLKKLKKTAWLTNSYGQVMLMRLYVH